VNTLIESRPYSIGSVRFLKAYLVTMRPYLLFLSGITGVVGLSFAPDVPIVRQLCISVASFLAYGFGQALTDCFQIDTDRISSPYRPLTQGRITPAQVLVVSIAGLIACISIMALCNPLNLLLGTMAGFGLATYTPFKRRWWGGPWYNAWIVGVLFLMGFTAGSRSGNSVLSPALGWTLIVVVAGYANFVLSGYFKDIEADRQSHYHTLPVVFGRAVASWTSDGLALIAATGIWLARTTIDPSLDLNFANVVSWMMILAAIATSVRAQFALHRVRTDAEAHTPIGLVVHTYILGLAGIAAAAHPAWAATLIGFYGLFVVTLNARPSRSQI
jgi:4-hydroxybenzoate polyprenyltransferase